MKIRINYKRIIPSIAIILVLIFSIGFFNQEKNVPFVQPQFMDLRSICELSLVKCHFNNVARFKQENATRSWFVFTKDKEFWLEYEASVVLGMNTELMPPPEIVDNVVTITLPPVEILYSEFNSSSITEDSFIIANKSAKIIKDDALLAIREATRDMELAVANNSSLRNTAKERAKVLLTNYIQSIGEQVGIDYTIVWKDL